MWGSSKISAARPRAPRTTAQKAEPVAVPVGKDHHASSMSATPFPYREPVANHAAEKMGWKQWLKNEAWDYTPQNLRDLIAPPKVLNPRTEAEKNDPNNYLTKAELKAWSAALSPLTARNARIVVTSAVHNLVGEGVVRLPQFAARLMQGLTYLNPLDLAVRSGNKIVTGKFSHPYDGFKETWVDTPTEHAVQSIWSGLSGGMPYQAYKDPYAYYNAQISGGMPDEERWAIESERDSMRLGYWAAVEIRFLLSDPLLKLADKIAKGITGPTETVVTYVSKLNRAKTFYKYIENLTRHALPQK